MVETRTVTRTIPDTEVKYKQRHATSSICKTMDFGIQSRDVQSNLFNTHTKGTGPSVRFTEVSVL